MSCCQRRELCRPPIEEFASADYERVCSELDQTRERCVDLTFGAGIQDMDLQPNRVRRLLHVFRLGLGSGIFRVHEQTDNFGCRHRVVQQSHSLRYLLGGLPSYMGNVVPRSVEAFPGSGYFWAVGGL